MAVAGAGTQKTTIAWKEACESVVNLRAAFQVDSKSFAHMIPFLVLQKIINRLEGYVYVEHCSSIKEK
jgi:hypothetical protein